MKRLKILWKRTVLFSIGGIGYAVIEILWRGRTHWTMVLAGGSCFLLFSRIAEKFKSSPLVIKAMISAFGVTLVELIFGIVFNIIFGMHVWDYSNERFNLLGQICPLFSLFWSLLALVFLPLADKLNNKLNICSA
ncbi:MAG: hypothetical protein J6Q85_02930 [Clostridia bacterium]|nr:hypothetical protein [Clostridia bacterium]